MIVINQLTDIVLYFNYISKIDLFYISWPIGAYCRSLEHE